MTVGLPESQKGGHFTIALARFPEGGYSFPGFAEARVRHPELSVMMASVSSKTSVRQGAAVDPPGL
eukprot:1562090-Lingulodinium_polyedra.AAC.1